MSEDMLTLTCLVWTVLIFVNTPSYLGLNQTTGLIKLRVCSLHSGNELVAQRLGLWTTDEKVVSLNTWFLSY